MALGTTEDHGHTASHLRSADDPSVSALIMAVSCASLWQLLTPCIWVLELGSNHSEECGALERV